MGTGRSTQLARATGEYLVAAELCRRGLVATTFAGNVPEFDILAISEKYKTIPVQVKTIQTEGGAWQFDAKDFLDIKVRNGVQRIRGKLRLPNPDLPCVFVHLVGQGKDKFYVCRSRDVQSLILRRYRQYLQEKKGVRPRNPDSTHHALWPRHLEKFKNKWALITR
jgi:hypothetical protein